MLECLCIRTEKQCLVLCWANLRQVSFVSGSAPKTQALPLLLENQAGWWSGDWWVDQEHPGSIIMSESVHLLSQY